MARSNVHPSSKKRILGAVKDRLLYDVEPASAQRKATPDADVLQQGTERGAGQPAPRHNQDADRPRAARRQSAKKRHRFVSMAIAKLIVLGMVIVAGAAAIIWLRNLGEAFGVNWIGD